MIGAGVSGALAAFVLVEAGFDVVVVEQRSVASGSTSANTALLLYECDLPMHQLAERMGEPDAVTVYRLCRDALARFGDVVASLADSCGFAPRSSLYLASEPDHVPGLRREHELRLKHGFAVDFLERAELEMRYGLSRPAALLSHDAAEVDPRCLTKQLLACGVRRGVRVYEGTRIAELKADGWGLELQTDAGCRINARDVILATGYDAERYLGEHLARDNSTFALATEPVDELAGWADRSLIWETARPYLYLRRTSDDRVLIGGLDEPEVSAERRDALLERKTRGLLEGLRGMFPDLEPRVAAAWCGTFLNTRDSLPYICTHPDSPRLHLALCYGGNGTTFSLVAAETVRDILLGHARPEMRLFRLRR